MSAALGFMLGSQEHVRNNRGKRAVSIRATEDLLYFQLFHRSHNRKENVSFPNFPNYQ